MSCCNSNCNHDPCGSSFNQSVTKAAQYAQYAQTQANKAEELWLEFNALYLGSFSAAPTTDNDGNPLQEGALYFNSTSNQMFVWQGGSWIDFDFDEFTPFLATGTTNARNLVTRFADFINVKDFGAVGNGVADDTAAIQAAIIAGGNKPVYFPQGIYAISNTILIGKSLVSLIGDSNGSAEIILTNPAVNCAIEFNAYIVGSGLFKNSLINMVVKGSTQNTFQVGVKLERPSNFIMINSDISGFSKCLEVKGGSNCFYNNCRLNGATVPTDPADTGTLEIQGLTDEGSVYTYTHLFVNCSINTGKRPIVIRSNDYISFSNCYINAGEISGVLIQNDGSSTNGIYNTNFDNCYFDRVSNTNPNAIAINSIDFGSPAVGFQVGLKITDCVFGDWDTAINVNRSFEPIVAITGCRFDFVKKSAITASGNATNILIEGNHFYNCTRSENGASNIYLDNVNAATITGNIFAYNESTPSIPIVGIRNAIRLTGAIGSVNITGNTVNTYPAASVTDFLNTATIGNLVVSGNSSDNTTNTIVGNVIGNLANSDPVSLDWYQEIVFSPTLTFGGNSVGLVISNQAAKATRIGDRVFFNIYLQLSNKGTSTGNAVIGGLPFSQSSSYPFTYTISCNLLNAAIGDANLDAISNLGTEINLRKQTGGTTVNLTDADFTNTTFMYIGGNYVVA